MQNYNKYKKKPKYDILIIIGDYNAKIGRERAYQKAIRNHKLHETANRNGELTCEHAIANDMVIANTFFQHKIYIKERGYPQTP